MKLLQAASLEVSPEGEQPLWAEVCAKDHHTTCAVCQDQMMMVVGLVTMMMGLAFFGSAVRYMVHMDRIHEYSDRKARSRARKEREQTELQMRRTAEIQLKPVRMGVQ